MFLAEARGVLARAEAAETVLRELGGLERGTLRVVASQTIAAYWLPPFLATFHARHTAIDIDLAIGNSEQAAARVHDGEADLGIVEGQIDDPALAHWSIGEDRFATGRSQPVRNAPIDADWLRQARWVLRESGSGTRSTFDRHLRRLGVDPTTLDVALTMPSNESVRTAVEAGAGVAVLSALAVGPAIEAGTLHVAPDRVRASPLSDYDTRSATARKLRTLC